MTEQQRAAMQAALEACGKVPTMSVYATEKLQEVEAILRAALAEQDAGGCWCDQQGIGAPGVSCGDCPIRDYKKHSVEPMAWKLIRSDGGDSFITSERGIAEAHNNWTVVPLYAAPPRREWAGLTDEEIEAAWKSCDPRRLLPSFTAAIEAALKEKNHD